MLHSQSVVLFHENFEAPGHADSVISSQTTPGFDDWGIDLMHAQTGFASDSCKVKTGLTISLTTLPANAAASTYVTLSFAHICKIDFLDLAEIWVSVDGGVNWTQLTSAQYLGTGSFAANGNRFSSNSYGATWQPNNPAAMPLNTWWKLETFDLTSFAIGQPDVRVKFTLQDGGTPGGGGNYGWLLDNIKITGSQVFQNDVGVTALNSPLSIGCGINLSQVTITVKNFGSAPQTNIPVNFSLNNGVPVTETFTGTMAPGTQVNYTFAQLMNIPAFPVDTTIILTAWTSLVADQNNNNNSISVPINVLHTPAPPQIPAVTIPLGTNAVLNVNSPDPVKWYDALIGGNLLAVGNSYVTPILNITTVYYPQATSTAGCVGPRASDTVFVSSNFSAISGIVSYQNTVATPMNNSIIKLYMGATLIAQTTTNNQGYYEFTNLAGGNYHLIATTTKPWGGGNALDGLLILKHFTGMTPLNGIFLEAANVNADGMVNAADALLTLQGFTGGSGLFQAGSWLFETANVAVPVNGSVIQNLKAICFGDVNGSYIPPF